MNKQYNVLAGCKKMLWSGWNPEIRDAKAYGKERECGPGFYVLDNLLLPDTGTRQGVVVAKGFSSEEAAFAWAMIYYAAEDTGDDAHDSYKWRERLTATERVHEEQAARLRDAERWQTIEAFGPHGPGSAATALPKGMKLYALTPVPEAQRKLLLLL